MPVRPFTIALRGMYYGRFGRGAESSFLTPVFIGYPDLVRGYDYGSFTADECGAAIDGSCPAFDRLVGSRMLVANAELRFPLWAAFGGDGFYGPLPVEVGVFADAGAAWDRSRSLASQGPRSKSRAQRRRRAPRQPARFRDRADRLLPAARPSRPRLDLAVQPQARILRFGNLEIWEFGNLGSG